MLGLAIQPMSVAPFLFARLERGGAGFTDEERRDLARMKRVFHQIFEHQPGAAEVLLFRIARTPACKHRSRRLPLEKVLSFI